MTVPPFAVDEELSIEIAGGFIAEIGVGADCRIERTAGGVKDRWNYEADEAGGGGMAGDQDGAAKERLLSDPLFSEFIETTQQV